MKSLREMIAAKGYVTSTYCTIPSPFVAEIIGRAGFDSVMMDLQHGLHDYASVVAALTALQACDVFPLVRTPPLDFALIGKLLDAGALGINCALVESREQAEALVRACRYPPEGERSFGPLRAALVRSDYRQRERDLISVFAMIESAAGLADVEQIAATPGLDGIYIGAFDLAYSMGLPPDSDGRFPTEVLDAVETIRRTCCDAGRICGVMSFDGEKAAAMVERGFQFITLSNDITLLSTAARSLVSAFCEALGAKP
jgi:4-hydroxy-2-oxoheptanedioate aldolase